MRSRVHSLEPCDRDVRVDLRRLEIGVPQDLLQITDIVAAFVHERGHRVTKYVHVPGFRDAGAHDVAMQALGESRRPDARAARTHKKRRT